MMWGFGLGGLWMLLLMIGVILVIVWAVQSGSGARSARPLRAIEILDERYARGDIEREEFLSRRAELES